MQLQLQFIGQERKTFEAIRALLGQQTDHNIKITWCDNSRPRSEQSNQQTIQLISFCHNPTDALLQLRSMLRQPGKPPIIVLIPKADPVLDQKLMQLGIDDCLPLEELSGPLLLRTLHHAVQRHASTRKISYLATHDRLTGVANRYLLLEHAGHVLSRSKRQQQKFALMFVGLDGFRRINDSLGHEVGDMLLQEVATRLQENIRETDLLARYAGDEFVLMLEDIGEEKNVAKAAHHIQKILAKPFRIQTHELFISASIGVASFPENGQQVDTILQAADSALAHAKETGANQLYFFSPELNAKVLRKLELERYLRRAMLREEFVVYYQPKVDTQDGRVMGAEALLRWQHPELGLVSPAEFIPLLEELSLLPTVEQWVLKKVCLDAAAIENLWGKMLFSVNISGSHFRHGNLKENIYLALQQADLDASSLEIELTEDIMIDHVEHNHTTLDELSELGISIALDDFGKGYSSLSYLRNFPATVLKIDKAFIDNMEQPGKEQAIVESLIELSHRLGIKVVAEGVEQVEQVAHLSRFGCDYIQGYYFAKPMPRDAFEDYISIRQVVHQLPTKSLQTVG